MNYKSQYVGAHQSECRLHEKIVKSQIADGLFDARIPRNSISTRVRCSQGEPSARPKHDLVILFSLKRLPLIISIVKIWEIYSESMALNDRTNRLIVVTMLYTVGTWDGSGTKLGRPCAGMTPVAVSRWPIILESHLIFLSWRDKLEEVQGWRNPNIYSVWIIRFLMHGCSLCIISC